MFCDFVILFGIQPGKVQEFVEFKSSFEFLGEPSQIFCDFVLFVILYGCQPPQLQIIPQSSCPIRFRVLLSGHTVVLGKSQNHKITKYLGPGPRKLNRTSNFHEPIELLGPLPAPPPDPLPRERSRRQGTLQTTRGPPGRPKRPKVTPPTVPAAAGTPQKPQTHPSQGRRVRRPPPGWKGLERRTR